MCGGILSGAVSDLSDLAGPDPQDAASPGQSGSPPVPASRDPSERNRRTFTKEYKLAILMRAKELRSLGRGGIQAMLRQEGLRTSHLTEWKKQLSDGRLSPGLRGRPERNQDALSAEIRRLKHRLMSLEKRCLHAESLLALQRKYVQAASLKLKRKDRGLLSNLIAQVEGTTSITAACRALGLSRPDYYRTINPLKGRP